SRAIASRAPPRQLPATRGCRQARRAMPTLPSAAASFWPARSRKERANPMRRRSPAPASTQRRRSRSSCWRSVPVRRRVARENFPALASLVRRRYKPAGPADPRRRPTKRKGRRVMNRREILQGSTALAVAAAAGLRPARAQGPIGIKFSPVWPPDAAKGKASEKFKALAEQYTNGRVKIEVYANSSLYKDKEEVEALQLGAVQMLAPSTAKFGSLGFTEFEALDLPFIFR